MPEVGHCEPFEKTALEDGNHKVAEVITSATVQLETPKEAASVTTCVSCSWQGKTPKLDDAEFEVFQIVVGLHVVCGEVSAVDTGVVSFNNVRDTILRLHFPVLPSVPRSTAEQPGKTRNAFRRTEP